jgi:hypothetical protein
METLIKIISANKYNLKVIFFCTFTMVLLFGVFRFTYPQFMNSGWFSIGNIFQFQLGKVVIYANCFMIGILAFSGKWFSNNNGIGKIWIWAIICFCLFGLNMLALKNITSSETPPLVYKLAFCVLYPLWALSFVGFFISFAQKLMNCSTKLYKNLSENSYNMYLVHYIFPYSLPLLLSNLNIPVLIKFLLVSVSTIICSFIISKFIIKKLLKKGAYCT